MATRPAQPPETGPRLSFGPFVLDPETGRILTEGRIVPLAPKPFETLRYLAGRSGRTISKAELMEKLWPDTFVTDDVLVQCVVDIRHALGDDAKSPKYIQTIPRRGYQFLAPVAALEAEAPPAAAPLAAPVLATAPSALAPRPSSRVRYARAIAVLVVVSVAAAALLAVVGVRRVEKVEILDPGTLVVIPLSVEEAAPQSGWLREGLAEMIRSQLGQTTWIRVVARHRVAAALQEAGYSEAVGPSPEAVGAIARRLHAERLVTGSFVRLENRFVINAQVIDVATGRTEGTVSARGQGPGDLLDAVDDLCLKLVHTLSPRASAPGGPDFRPAPLTTRSVDASRQYVEALAWFARGGRLGAEQAETRLDEALKLDSSFAHAYLKKAEIQHWRSRWGYGDPDPAPAILAATGLSAGLPERDRLLVASFEALIVRKQPADALRHWDSLLRLQPTYAEEMGVPSLAADTLLRLGRWDDVVTMGEAHVDSPSLPDSERALLASSLSRAYRRKGEFERAVQRARQAVRLWPSQNGPRFLRERAWLGRVSLEAGLRAQALVELRGIAVAPDADAVCLTAAAWGLYMAGESKEAATVIERALALDPTFGNAYHLRGWMRLAQGEYETADRDLETAFARTPRAYGDTHVGAVNGDVSALYYAGVANQKMGRRAAASAAFDRAAALCREVLRTRQGERGEAAAWQAANFLARAAAREGRDAPEPPRLAGDDTTYFVQTARLHAVQGRNAEALRELAQGLALGFGERRHIQDDPDFESLRSDPEFQRLVTALVPH